MSALPLLGQGRAVVVPAPGRGAGYWAGASCARNREPAAAAALEDKTLDVQAAGGEGVTFVITDQDV